MANCPVCKQSVVSENASSAWQTFSCPRCGKFSLSVECAEDLPNHRELTSDKRAILSYHIRRLQGQELPKFTFEKLQEILETEKLPDVAEQINLVIYFVGKKSEFLGQWHDFSENDSLALEAYAGCVNNKSVKVILAELKASGFLTEHAPPRYALTFKGWQKFEEIDKGKTESKKAFMAMKFDKSLDDMYLKFQKAVEQTGFVLNRLDELAEPGLIDVRMYQRIKTCKFVIADLTHGNQGAYWEAGYAAGLGKKVIYTCQKSVFDEDKIRTEKVIHFDVSHHQMILWDENNMQDAIEKLKAMIRVTFPEDATQEDKNDKAA